MYSDWYYGRRTISCLNHYVVFLKRQSPNILSFLFLVKWREIAFLTLLYTMVDWDMLISTLSCCLLEILSWSKIKEDGLLHCQIRYRWCSFNKEKANTTGSSQMRQSLRVLCVDKKLFIATPVFLVVELNNLDLSYLYVCWKQVKSLLKLYAKHKYILFVDQKGSGGFFVTFKVAYSLFVPFWFLIFPVLISPPSWVEI